MYKLMIVDDEIVIRDALRKYLNWGEIDIELVCEAEDGIEAIKVFEEFKPDIILMDINIPFKNGLDVAREILSIDCHVKVIIITGHDKFEYAQKALKVGAFDLLLKPMDKEDVYNTIKKACNALDNIKQEKLKSEKLEKILAESMPVLREKFVNGLLSGIKYSNHNNIEERFSYLNIDIINKFYNTAVIIPETKKIDSKDYGMTFIVLKNITEEVLEKNGIKKFAYIDKLHRLIVIFSYSDRSVYNNIDGIFISIRDEIKFYLNIDAYIGIGNQTISVQDLENSYKSSVESLSYINIYGRDNVVNIKNIYVIEKRHIIYSSRDIDSIITSFKTGDINEFKERFDSLLNKIILSSLANIDFVKRMFVELTAGILRVCDEIELDIENLFDREGPYNKIISFNNLLDLKDWMLKICSDLMNDILEKRHTRVNNVIELAKGYIRDNYNNKELDLKMASEYVGLSSVYFCKLFYQEAQVHFSDYLNIVRIEQAKKFLKESIFKVYEIAYNVGYNDPKHFNVTFKKLTGKTPNEYRNSV